MDSCCLIWHPSSDEVLRWFSQSNNLKNGTLYFTSFNVWLKKQAFKMLFFFECFPVSSYPVQRSSLLPKPTFCGVSHPKLFSVLVVWLYQNKSLQAGWKIFGKPFHRSTACYISTCIIAMPLKKKKGGEKEKKGCPHSFDLTHTAFN